MKKKTYLYCVLNTIYSKCQDSIIIDILTTKELLPN